ncbi:hypothetical protein [Pseudomonas putida]
MDKLNANSTAVLCAAPQLIITNLRQVDQGLNEGAVDAVQSALLFGNESAIQ